MASRLRKEMLDLLERDLEFRYAVAGYLGLSEIMKRLDRHEETMMKIWEEVKALREGQNRLWEEVRGLKATVGRVSTTLDRLTISVEEEARSVIKHRIKQDLNIEVELDRIFVDSKEINIYGASGDLCVIGEATVRLGVNLVEELLDKIELIKQKRPDLLRDKIIKVIYADYAVPEAVEAAKNKGVWLLRWDKDLAPMKIEST
ncbi:MAG: hypothetical protein ABWK01_04460 [Infirmifilum sp.]